MDLNLLRLFAEIVEAPSLSAAARRTTGVTRSHVSQRLQALERDLGAQLMRRTTRHLALTEAGQTVYEHALRVRQEAEAAAAAVGRLGSEAAGAVRLSVPTGLGRLVVVPLLLEFQRRYGRIDLSVRFANRIDDLVAADVDVALKVAARAPDDCVARELARVRWCLCAAPSYLAGGEIIRTARDLADHRFVCPPTPGRRLAIRIGPREVVTVAPRVQSEDFCFLLDAVRAGLGIGLLPHYMVREALAAGSLLPLLADERFETTGEKLFLLTTRNRYPSPAQRTLVDYLIMTMKEQLG